MKSWVSFLVANCLLISSVCGAILHVGSNQAIRNIKDALALSKANDTLYVHGGVYKEGPLVISKSLYVIGIDWPELDGDHKNELLVLTGANILIEGFLIKNSGASVMNDFASIRCVDTRRVTIRGNKIINSHFGIHVSNSTEICIQQNFIQGIPKTEQSTGNGIHLWKCEKASILNNTISGHRDGIYFEFVSHSTIQDNLSFQNIRYGLHFMFSHSNLYLCNEFSENGAGVAVMYSHNVQMEDNIFSNNWGPSAYGILLKDISDSRIERNVFLKNTVGIHFEGTNRIRIIHNTFRENGWAMKVQASCSDNHFERNNIFQNSFDVATNGSLSLNLFIHNYWDKYDGYDLNKDGIGDIPYHPVNLYSMIVEQNPGTIILMRSILISFLDKAEKAIPSLTPENLTDSKPSIKPNLL